MSNPNSIEYLEKELARYKKHLKKLKEDPNYDNFEEKRKTIAEHYEENISRLRVRIKKHQPSITNK